MIKRQGADVGVDSPGAKRRWPRRIAIGLGCLAVVMMIAGLLQVPEQVSFFKAFWDAIKSGVIDLMI